MNLIFILTVMALFIGLTWYIITPLLSGNMNSPITVNKHDLNRKKTLLLRQIKELDMDHHIGNISDEDYAINRRLLKREISEIISEIKNVS
ncbi:MAG: hypothetical protein HOC41_05790 [Candidatus Marinimicrobia bacterium]|jgi:hypothetical protein|nr:hypothetical protein [Candidatus Neomarinimicrobiota bacterium]MBT3945467.1 hypothetical protein [Candidatus Neomarinimicrobiota bacterium]MBT4555176.1 hypothetical protein [Candidatus Neomarinimicrobiota bacterium]MBT4752570.1 hypothetical protein [Candidatus Neomarinimicrobiota bacterium]MBT5114665.1 hypothetical protein [Candidatus Neomarinimicrobiota bacterium]|tara:strand:+ start:13206 stop:13478 length:273 start_codon:yes stop_codon:yes gene_type:complete